MRFETSRPESTAALQILNFTVITEHSLDDCDQLASHWIEIGQTVDRTRLVVPAIEDFKHVAIETERDLNCPVTRTESKQHAIIWNTGFPIRALVIRRRSL